MAAGVAHRHVQIAQGRRFLEKAHVPRVQPVIAAGDDQPGVWVLAVQAAQRYVAEGRRVVEAEQRYGRIFQIGTYGRFGASRRSHKIMAS